MRNDFRVDPTPSDHFHCSRYERRAGTTPVSNTSPFGRARLSASSCMLAAVVSPPQSFPHPPPPPLPCPVHSFVCACDCASVSLCMWCVHAIVCLLHNAQWCVRVTVRRSCSVQWGESGLSLPEGVVASSPFVTRSACVSVIAECPFRKREDRTHYFRVQALTLVFRTLTGIVGFNTQSAMTVTLRIVTREIQSSEAV